MRKPGQSKGLQCVPYFALPFLLRSQVIISPFLALVKILLEKTFSGLAIRATLKTSPSPSRRTHFRDPRPHRSKSYQSSNRSPPRNYGKLRSSGSLPSPHPLQEQSPSKSGALGETQGFDHPTNGERNASGNSHSRPETTHLSPSSDFAIVPPPLVVARGNRALLNGAP